MKAGVLDFGSSVIYRLLPLLSSFYHDVGTPNCFSALLVGNYNALWLVVHWCTVYRRRRSQEKAFMQLYETSLKNLTSNIGHAIKNPLIFSPFCQFLNYRMRLGSLRIHSTVSLPFTMHTNDPLKMSWGTRGTFPFDECAHVFGEDVMGPIVKSLLVSLL